MNMTGDPNQQSSSNLFGVNYNFATANPVDWAKYPNQASIDGAMSGPPVTNQFPTPANFAASSSGLSVTPPIVFPQQTMPESVSFTSPSFPTQNVPSVEPVSFSPPTAPLTNYSFGTADRPPAPVQFPFPVTITPCGSTDGEFGNKPLLLPFRCKRKTDSPP